MILTNRETFSQGIDFSDQQRRGGPTPRFILVPPAPHWWRVRTNGARQRGAGGDQSGTSMTQMSDTTAPLLLPCRRLCHPLAPPCRPLAAPLPLALPPVCLPYFRPISAPLPPRCRPLSPSPSLALSLALSLSRSLSLPSLSFYLPGSRSVSPLPPSLKRSFPPLPYPPLFRSIHLRHTPPLSCWRPRSRLHPSPPGRLYIINYNIMINYNITISRTL